MNNGLQAVLEFIQTRIKLPCEQFVLVLRLALLRFAQKPCPLAFRNGLHKFENCLGTIIIVLTVFFISCSSTAPKKTVEPDSTYSESELWQAISQLSLEFPIHDLSKEEGSLESDWIYETSLARYKFFVTIEKATQAEEFSIDIQSQYRKAESSKWSWSEPSLDKEEKIKNHIHEHLKKNRAA